MGRHDKDHAGKPDGRSPAKTAEDLCREHGHRKHYPYPSYPMGGKWMIHWECQRGCGQSGEDETSAP